MATKLDGFKERMKALENEADGLTSESPVAAVVDVQKRISVLNTELDTAIGDEDDEDICNEYYEIQDEIVDLDAEVTKLTEDDDDDDDDDEDDDDDDTGDKDAEDKDGPDA